MSKSGKVPPSLTENLSSFLDGHVYPDRRAAARSQQGVLDRAVGPILARVGEADDRFQSDVCPDCVTSDCRFGVTSRDAHGFDLLVPLHGLLRRKTLGVAMDTEEAVPTAEECFVFSDSCRSDNPYVRPLPGFGFLATDTKLTFLQDLCGREENVNGSLLMPSKVLRRFHQLVEESVDELEQECFWEREPTVYQVTVKKDGPAIVLTILMRGNTFVVSLLPAVNIRPWPEDMLSVLPSSQWMTLDRVESIKPHFYLLAIRPKGTEDARKLWCSCFYASENQLASRADEGSVDGTCRQRSLDALVALVEENRQDFQPVSARLVRSLFLQQCAQYPADDDWAETKLGRAFVDLFLALIRALLSGTCPHFFLPQTNLLAGYDKRDLKPVAEHLKAILDDIVQRPDKTHFLGDVEGRRKYSKMKMSCGPVF